MATSSSKSTTDAPVYHLVVKEPFDGYDRGALVTASDEIADLLENHAPRVLRVAPQDPAE